LHETCFVLASQNDIQYVLRKRSAKEFCMKLGISNADMLEMSQNAYGTEAMRRATVF
jgi:hypothetical protein